MQAKASDVLPEDLKTWLQRVRFKLRIRQEFRKDLQRYTTGATDGIISPRHSPVQLEAEITKDYHRIEKGLALREPRRPFGASVKDRLQFTMALAGPTSTDAVHIESANAALSALDLWNSHGRVDSRVAPFNRSRSGWASTPQAFFESRHSIRDFDLEAPASDVTHEAIRLALASPSVCNRQPWRVHTYQGEDVQTVLRHQNGNSGFGHLVPSLAVVTVDLRLFTGLGERNQAWIEGGIFASTLVWTLHSMGLGTCMLNLSLSNVQADRLRADAGIPDHEVLISCIAIGTPKEGNRLARSIRRSVDEVVNQHSE